jgi:transketolase
MATIEFLRDKARQIRLTTLEMLRCAGSGHPGGSLSATDLMVALYYHKMRLKPDQPQWEDRDRFVLSKGHANPPLYAILADKGYFERNTLWQLRKLGCMLQGHPDMRKAQGVDFSTGSLGQGMSAAVGMAMAGKLRRKDWHVYTMTGDGELQEGIVWEAAMAAANYRLDNLTVIVDNNGLQIDGCVDEVMCLGNLRAKFEAFGFAVEEIDGHDFSAILPALDARCPGKPCCIIAKTVKGKGVPFMENDYQWHGRIPSTQQMEQALCALKEDAR